MSFGSVFLDVHDGASIVPVISGLSDQLRQRLQASGCELLDRENGDVVVYTKQYSQEEQDQIDGGLGFHKGYTLNTFFESFPQLGVRVDQQSVDSYAAFLDEETLSSLQTKRGNKAFSLQFDACEEFKTKGGAILSLLERYFGDSSFTALDIKTGLHGNIPIQSKLCADDCDYVYYGNYGEQDHGWGCCYRVVQMCTGALIRKGLIPVEEEQSNGPNKFNALPHENVFPTTISIQRKLVSIGRLKADHIGSHVWLEPPELAAIVRSFNIDCAEFEFDGSNPTHLEDFNKILWLHFGVKGARTPVAVDDKTYTYAVVGICQVATKDMVDDIPSCVPVSCTDHWVLVFDPHASGDITFESFQTGNAHQFAAMSPLRPRGSARWVPFGSMFGTSRGRKMWMVALPCSA